MSNGAVPVEFVGITVIVDGNRCPVAGDRDLLIRAPCKFLDLADAGSIVVNERSGIAVKTADRLSVKIADVEISVGSKGNSCRAT